MLIQHFLATIALIVSGHLTTRMHQVKEKEKNATSHDTVTTVRQTWVFWVQGTGW